METSKLEIQLDSTVCRISKKKKKNHEKCKIPPLTYCRSAVLQEQKAYAYAN